MLSDFAVEPSVGPLEPGTYTARVVNGGTVHALEVDGPAGEMETAQLQPGKSVDLELDLSEAGEYELTCPSATTATAAWRPRSPSAAGGPATTDETTTDEGGYRY